MHTTSLETVWFLLICVLWSGYLVLEGFDFGVGILLTTLGRTPGERRDLLHSFGHVWDGNEVWLLTAGGATFAAFPQWYATLFSGFYLPLFLILVGLIIRNVGIEFWHKQDTPRWRAGWEIAIVAGSLLPAILWGVAWANIVSGVPIDGAHEFAGNFWSLINPYALMGGVTSLLLFLAHGSSFLTLRLTGDLLGRATRAARILQPLAALAVVAFLVWTLAQQAGRGGVELFSAIWAALAIGAALAAVALARRSAGWSFTAGALTIVATFASLFSELWPNAMPSTTSPAFTLTLHQAASHQYTLTVMTVVAVIFVPIVLAYQAWTYWVFRRRVGLEELLPGTNPLDALGGRGGRDGGR